ncbi:MAG: acetyl-CoA carboxylase biotin carboxylase subunit [Anaerolineae bacterium]
MFKRVLVANRGEIAVRVLRACQELGLETVTVYSDVDRNALHVRYADEAYPIGPAPAGDSYLRIDRIIDVAIRAKVDAIHPGYGFLAENPQFARACGEAGIAFVGPTAEAISLMGDKVAARRTMQAAGVPVVPGSDKGLADDEIVDAAEEIGYPLFIKAAAGGGGKGMRAVDSPDELLRALGAARREAMGAFGDDTIYLERIIPEARHIEFQLLADHHGNVIHLGERECSIQRRHQKLIEEAPSPALDDDLRQRMGAVAIQAAKAAGYTNTGTVEFLLDRDKNFYFLEMNTRLQVEHPVTELVSGVDIVKEQLRIASGRKIRYKQEDIEISGWAMECRISAEDPYNNFLPSVGKVTGLVEPTGPGVRVDSGIYEGFEVSLYYDPLIAKVAVRGETRGEALLRMRRALREYRIVGIKTSIPFHQRILDSTNFIGGVFDTTFLEDGFDLLEQERDECLEAAAIAAAILAHQRRQRALVMPLPRSDGGLNPWKLAGRREVLRG